MIFRTSSGSTGKPKILEYQNKWMGEFPIYINDVQGPGDIPKLFKKFGEKRAKKIASGKDNLGKNSVRLIFKIKFSENSIATHFQTNLNYKIILRSDC